jgi:hypothetical protein
MRLCPGAGSGLKAHGTSRATNEEVNRLSESEHWQDPRAIRILNPGEFAQAPDPGRGLAASQTCELRCRRWSAQVHSTPRARGAQRCFNSHSGNKITAYIAGGKRRLRRGPSRLRALHRIMTICRSLPADFCLRRAVRAPASSDRQTSPVEAFSQRLADGRKQLILKFLSALGAARLQFFPCFSEKGALAPLFAASVRVISSTTRAKLARASNAEEAMTLPCAKSEGDTNPAPVFGGSAAGCRRFPAGRRGRETSYPATRAGWARPRAPISLRYNDFSANEQTRARPRI